MNDTEIQGESIEHLDHNVACEGRAHGSGERPKADYWTNQHRCKEAFTCSPCLERDREWFSKSMAAGMEVICAHCSRLFFTFAEMLQVVPL